MYQRGGARCQKDSVQGAAGFRVIFISKLDRHFSFPESLVCRHIKC
jgi:hypothetical protein